MSSDGKYIDLDSKPNYENIDVDKDTMLQSLSSITQEIQRFHFYNDSYPKNDIFDIIKMYKLNLISKNKQMKKLSENIKIACFVAKTVISAKEKQSSLTKNFVETVQNESAKVFIENKNYQKMIEELTKENTMVHNKIDNLHNWIHLGYEKVQNIRNEPVEDLNLFTKLKKIILYCGQYYADFHNENQKCKQLEQKIRFYQNKLKILESNLKVVTDELKNIRYQNMKLKRQKKYKEQIGFLSNIPVAYSQSPIQEELYNTTSQKNIQTIHKSRKELKHTQFDLSSHFLLVKNLLTDQESMLQSLNQLSKDLNSF
ncbi:unnamed protein product [Parnassius mnemosyne]|uniref:Uncharacterized protein n=1 Tax=Parnassius mnemosyne TaxID=213953 RepID=A0AAV1K9D8_9NEOP